MAGGPDRRISALAWSPDDRLIAQGMVDGTVGLWKAADGSPLRQWPAFPLEVESVHFEVGGRWLLGKTRWNGVTVWDITTGHQVLKAGTMGDYSPRESIRGCRTLAIDEAAELRFSDLVLPQTITQLTGHRSSIERLAWSRDNRHLVSLGNSFEIRVWDIARGSAIDEFRPPQARETFFAPNAAVALSDDGRLLAYASGGGPTARRSSETSPPVGHWPNGSYPMGSSG